MDNLGIFDDETNTEDEGGQLSNRLRFDFGGTTSIDHSEFIIQNWSMTSTVVASPTPRVLRVSTS